MAACRIVIGLGTKQREFARIVKLQKALTFGAHQLTERTLLWAAGKLGNERMNFAAIKRISMTGNEIEPRFESAVQLLVPVFVGTKKHDGDAISLCDVIGNASRQSTTTGGPQRVKLVSSQTDDVVNTSLLECENPRNPGQKVDKGKETFPKSANF